MAKSNNKKNRTDGVIKDGNIKYPDPMTSYNNPMDTYGYTDKDRIHQQSKQNQRY